jgi:hypothetical protein
MSSSADTLLYSLDVTWAGFTLARFAEPVRNAGTALVPPFIAR